MAKKIEEDLGVVPDTEDLGVVPDNDVNDLEIQMVTEKQQAESQVQAAAAQEQAAREADADPKNWTLERTKKHFKDNPPKTLQEEAFAKQLMDEKKAAIKEVQDKINGEHVAEGPQHPNPEKWTYEQTKETLKKNPPANIKDEAEQKVFLEKKKNEFKQEATSAIARFVRSIMGQTPLEQLKTSQYLYDHADELPQPIEGEKFDQYKQRFIDSAKLKEREAQIAGKGTVSQFDDLIGVAVGGQLIKAPLATAKILAWFAAYDKLAETVGVNEMIKKVPNATAKDTLDIMKFAAEGALAGGTNKAFEVGFDKWRSRKGFKEISKEEIKAQEEAKNLGVVEDVAPEAKIENKANITQEKGIFEDVPKEVSPGDLAVVNGRAVSIQGIEGDNANVIVNGEKSVVPLRDLKRVNTPDEVINLQEVVAARERAQSIPETIKINTPERNRLREMVAVKHYGDGNYAKEGRVDIVIGGPSTGKSQVVDPLLKKHRALLVDNDNYKIDLPGYENGLGAAAVHKESAMIEDKIRSLSQWEGDNVVVARLGKNPDAIRKVVQEYKDAGYKNFSLHLVELPVEKAMFRTVNRFIERGRFVDPLYVKEVSLTPKQTYDTLKQEGLFNEYTKYSTDVPKGTAPVVQPDVAGSAPGESGLYRQPGPTTIEGGSGPQGGNEPGSIPQQSGVLSGSSEAVVSSPKRLAQSTADKVANLQEIDQAKLILEMDRVYKTPEGNLFLAIRKLGGIKPNEGGFMSNELSDIPASLKNKNSTSTLDDIATQLSAYGWKFENGEVLKTAILHQQKNPLPKIERSNYREFIRQLEKNQKVLEQIAGEAGKRRKFITTVKESEKTAPEVAKNIESRYDPIANSETLAEAKALVEKDYNAAQALVEGKERPTRVSNAVAVLLIDRAQNEGRFEDAIRLVERTAEKNTEMGQAIQALSMYNRLSREGILRFAEKQLRKVDVKVDEKLARDLTERADKIKAFDEWLKNPDWESPLYKDTRGQRTPWLDMGKIVEGENTPMGQGVQKDMQFGYSVMSRARKIETALMLKEIAKRVPPTKLQKISMVQTLAQLLNPKTIIRNILGNLGMIVTENLADVVGTALDAAVSLRTGKRTQYLPDVKTQFKGMVQGAKEGTEEALLGIDLKPNRNKFDLPRNSVFNEGVMGGLEKALSVSLGAMDRAFYQAAFNDSLRMQIRAAKISEPTAEMIEKAHFDGLYRTFQDENFVSNLFVGLKKALNAGKDWGLGDMVLKYPKTPANLLARGIEYSPFGFVQSIMKISEPLFGKEFDQAGFVKSTSRALVGSSLLVGTGAILAEMGIITGKRQKDKDIAATQQNVGIRDYQINIDALKRFVASGLDPDQAKIQEGDTLVTYDWMQPSSIGLALGANMVLSSDQSAADKIVNMADRIFEASETLASQPLVQGLKKITGYGSISEGVAQTIQGIPASFVPTVLNQVRQLMDNTARNTKTPNWYEEAYTQAVAKIPGVSGQLPARINSLGKQQEMYQAGTNNPFNVFLNPMFVSKYKPDKVSEMVLGIWERSGQSVQFPRISGSTIKVGADQIEMTPEQYGEFQAYIGEKTNKLFSILADNERFMSLPDDQKAKLLQGYLTDINTGAKIEILGYRPKRYSQDMIDIMRSISLDHKQIKENEADDLVVEDNE